MAVEWGVVLSGMKILKEIVEKYQDPKFNDAFMDIQMKIIELQQDYIKITEENERLKKEKDLARMVHFDRPYIFIEGDPDPRCPRCYDSEGKTIRLLRRERRGSGDWSRKCPECETRFFEGDDRHFPSQRITANRKRDGFVQP